MRKQFLLFFFLNIFYLCNFAQIVYQNIHEIKFGLTAAKNKDYTALIIRNSDGEKQLRVQYFNSKTKKYTSYEVPFYTSLSDFNKEALKIKPVVIYGTDTAACFPVYFNYFSTGRFNESKKGVTIARRNNTAPAFISAATALRREDLKENYVRNFFLENEAFYMDLFDPSQSSKKNIQSVPWFYFINIANTLDKKIGKGCKLDIDNLGPLFRRIPLELDLPLKEISINGNKFSKQAVVDALAAVKPQKQDIVVFYYSGHGFSYKEDEAHKYPQLALKIDLTIEDEKLIKASTKNIEEIFETIKAKDARLNVVISDCCNNLIPYYRRKPNTIATTREPAKGPNRVEMANLFLKNKGSILMSAATKGQVALTDEELGSIYTFQLSNKLIAALWGNANNVTWEQIITQTNMATSNMSKGYDCGETNKPSPCFQEPIYKLELR